MKAKTIILTVAALASVLLAGCSDAPATIEPTAESCSPDFYRALPAGKQRDNLVEACMTKGQYLFAEPQTF